MKQVCVIEHWLPTMSANGSHGHWSTQRKKHDIDRDTAWAAAKHAGWVFVPGKVKLTITLVFPNNRRRDADNLHYRVKGVLDGLKCPMKTHDPVDRICVGFFTDDSTEWLELDVRAVVEPGRRATELVLELA